MSGDQDDKREFEKLLEEERADRTLEEERAAAAAAIVAAAEEKEKEEEEEEKAKMATDIVTHQHTQEQFQTQAQTQAQTHEQQQHPSAAVNVVNVKMEVDADVNVDVAVAEKSSASSSSAPPSSEVKTFITVISPSPAPAPVELKASTVRFPTPAPKPTPATSDGWRVLSDPTAIREFALLLGGSLAEQDLKAAILDAFAHASTDAKIANVHHMPTNATANTAAVGADVPTSTENALGTALSASSDTTPANAAAGSAGGGGGGGGAIVSIAASASPAGSPLPTGAAAGMEGAISQPSTAWPSAPLATSSSIRVQQQLNEQHTNQIEEQENKRAAISDHMPASLILVPSKGCVVEPFEEIYQEAAFDEAPQADAEDNDVHYSEYVLLSHFCLSPFALLLLSIFFYRSTSILLFIICTDQPFNQSIN